MKAIEDVPEIFAGVLVATCFKQFLRSDGRLLRVFITEAQRGRRERSRFSTGQLPCTEGFDAGVPLSDIIERDMVQAKELFLLRVHSDALAILGDDRAVRS